MAYSHTQKQSVNKKDLVNQEKTRTGFSIKKPAGIEPKRDETSARVQQQKMGNAARQL